jgi:nicotinate-nucleotide adenylyltransferase
MSSDLDKLMREVDDTFRDAFGTTPLKQRLADIKRETFELTRFQDFKGLKQETGDLLASVLKLCCESDIDPVAAVQGTLQKINRRMEQYKSLGRKVNVAVLGGAFDPVTNGHVAVAQYVLEACNEFDEVWLMPCYQHMFGKQMSSSEDRLEMLKLACRADRRLKVCDFEIANKLSGETYYMVNRLLASPIAEQNNFSIIIGQDNANSFHQWVNFEFLENAIRFVVCPRKGYKMEGTRWYLNPPHIFLPESDKLPEVSSTEARRIIAEGSSSLANACCDEVCKYIAQKGLYKNA